MALPSSVSRKDKIKGLEVLRRRALQVILTPVTEDLYQSRDSDTLITIIISLMFGVNEKSRALKLLISLDQWEKATDMVGSYMDKEIIDHFELFNTLLVSYLEALSGQMPAGSGGANGAEAEEVTQPAPQATSPALLEKIWQVMPRNYSVYELLTLLQTFDSPQGGGSMADILSPEGRVTIGHIRDQLLTMVLREMRPRGPLLKA